MTAPPARCRFAALGAAAVLGAALLGGLVVAGCGDDGSASSSADGPLTVADGWVRPTAPFASVAAVYFVVDNRGEVDDRLEGAASDRCPTIQLHRSELVGDTARMREVEPDDLVIPAGGSLAFEPSGFHVMCLGFDEPFVDGQTATMTLSFAEAGDVEVAVVVEDR